LQPLVRASPKEGPCFMKSLKDNSHMPCYTHAASMPFPCCSPAMPCRINLHMLCRDPDILHKCPVLRESLRGSRKFPKC
jgi:hypothetical protein